jgi:hypothetical protein
MFAPMTCTKVVNAGGISDPGGSKRLRQPDGESIVNPARAKLAMDSTMIAYRTTVPGAAGSTSTRIGLDYSKMAILNVGWSFR